MLNIFGALSDLERENTLQRQKESIAVARIRDKKFGRPLLETPKEWEKVISLWEKGDITAVEPKKRLNLNRDTF